MSRDEDNRCPTLPGATSEECNDNEGNYPSSNHDNCCTCGAFGTDVEVEMDIDNPGYYYPVKCWDAYNATVAYHQGTSDFNRLAEENSFLSTHNFGLLVTVAGVLAVMEKMQTKEHLHMDKMHEELGRVYKENSLLNPEVDNLNFRLDSEVENLNANTIRDLENNFLDHHSCLVGAHQDKEELPAQIFELEEQVDGLRAAWINFIQEQHDADEDTNVIPFNL